MMRTKFKLAILAVAIVAAGLFVGCQSDGFTPEQSNAIVEVGQEASAILAERVEAAKAEAELLPEGSDERATLETWIDYTEKAQKAIEENVAILIAHQGEDGSIGADGILHAIGSNLPPPWGQLLILGGVGIATFIRNRKVRNAGRNIVASIERAAKKSPKFAEALNDPDVVAELQRTQTPLAKRIVDEAQGKKPAPLL